MINFCFNGGEKGFIWITRYGTIFTIGLIVKKNIDCNL